DVRQTLGLKPKRCEARLTLPLGEVIAAIEPGPQRVRELGEGLTAVQLRHRPRPGEWSMKEVMAHLLKVERDVFLPRLRRLATEDRPVFEAFDPDAWARERDHREGDFMEECRRFAAARAETVVLLRGAPAGTAERIGISAFFGPVSFGQYATHIADHDIEHLAQLAECRAVALRDG
ncbi:MAG TPA: DinB family protein, partial [Methylomirabilota bacterium]|nr:DinB family protein [Methylomirabilota bacterium]